MDKHTATFMVLMWIHFFAGITWIGLLYFFNLVNGPFAKTMDAETKKKVVPQLMPRALWWFRWGAMFTMLAGAAYMYLSFFRWGHGGFRGVDSNGNGLGLFNTTPGKWISIGAALGLIMWFNVWFIIWPAQKKLIAWVKAGQAPPEMAGLTKRAFLASRLNTYLSVPMLFCMRAKMHFPAFSYESALAVIVIGFLIAYVFISISSKVAANN